MSFHPDINTLQEWNARNCGCCNMPSCLEPELETRGALVVFCHFTNFEISEEHPDGCNIRYATNTQGRTVNGTNTTTVAGVVVLSNQADFTITYTETFDPPYTLNGFGSCVSERTCNIVGSFERFEKNFYTTEGSGEDLEITSGPFVSYEASGTVTNMAGMPDPTWTPGEDETEDDRPILPGPCSPVWEYEIKTYLPTTEGGLYTGSTLDTTVTGFQKDFFTQTQPAVGGINFPGGWVTGINDFADPLECSDLLALLAEIPEEDFNVTGSQLDVYFECYDCGTGAAGIVQQYRWIVPPCHPGSYYKITWDEVFFPQSYLDWLSDAQSSEDGIEVFDPNADPPPELPTITPKSWTWTGDPLGSCDPEDEENDYDARREISTRKSPWSLTILPTANGKIELRNALIQCYRSPYGNKPQKSFVLEDYSENDIDQDGFLDEDEPIAPPEP